MFHLPLALALNASTPPPGRDRRAAALWEVRHAPSAATSGAQPIVVRMLGDDDREALTRIAGRDSARAPAGSALLGAEVAGRLVAVLSLQDGAVVADPFRPSSAAVELLRLRARQLGHAPSNRRRLLARLHGRRPARASLAGSPPGGGGRLLQL